MLGRATPVPVFLAVESGVASRIGAALRRFHLAFDRVLITSGSGVTHLLADRVASGLPGTQVQRLTIGANDDGRVEQCLASLRLTRSEAVIAVGGGRVLDVSKIAAHEAGVPIITVPTTLAHDGMSSPVAVLRSGRRSRSVGVRVPIAVCVDLDVVRSAPERTLLSGVGDLLSNISAGLDWELAERHEMDRVEQVSRVVAKASAEGFLHTILGARAREVDVPQPLPPSSWSLEHYRALAEGLLCSGVAMAIAGSSRPCSGAEHLISHALDQLSPAPAAHGLQVGLATLFTLELHGAPREPVKRALQAIGFPTRPEQLQISRSLFLEAVAQAPGQRVGRYSILNRTTRADWDAAYDAVYSTPSTITR
jgi:glycerol-1-phosphate dehydrogenase [NAD(P)+]